MDAAHVASAVAPASIEHRLGSVLRAARTELFDPRTAWLLVALGFASSAAVVLQARRSFLRHRAG
jgi:hypothetical protein